MYLFATPLTLSSQTFCFSLLFLSSLLSPSASSSPNTSHKLPHSPTPSSLPSSPPPHLLPRHPSFPHTPPQSPPPPPTSPPHPPSSNPFPLRLRGLQQTMVAPSLSSVIQQGSIPPPPLFAPPYPAPPLDYIMQEPFGYRIGTSVGIPLTDIIASNNELLHGGPGDIGNLYVRRGGPVKGGGYGRAGLERVGGYLLPIATGVLAQPSDETLFPSPGRVVPPLSPLGYAQLAYGVTQPNYGVMQTQPNYGMTQPNYGMTQPPFI
eukprot:GHVQ01034701.1.p1 GENE.GHVQ01034701.1~~GHVQ01034701.1.p1  ORF type:complete len:263 (-),score=66.47 GHVQ01034701.1:450-1238(-)